MGGTGSGRPLTRAFLNALPSVGVAGLARFFQTPGSEITATWRNGMVTTLTVEPDGIVLRSLLPGEERPLLDRVRLLREPRHFGGFQLYFECPGCGLRAAKLFLIRRPFCRTCVGLPYYSQALGVEQRCIRTFQRIRKKIDPEAAGLPYGELPEKPRGMHWATYERLTDRALAALEEEEPAYEARLAPWMERLLG